MTTKFNVKKIREDFPMLNSEMCGSKLIYLDSASSAQKPNCVIDAISDYYRFEYANVHRAVYEHSVKATEKYCKVREQIRLFIGAHSENEIIFTRGTTEGLNIVASCYGKVFVGRGDEVLITEMEHHSNIVPWKLLCDEVGAQLVVAPINDKGELILDKFAQKLSNRTKIVSICHMSNVFGTINPIKEIVEMVHEKGGIVVVDGAQSIPHIPTDLSELDADFYVFSGHKCYGPTGIGVLYGKESLLKKMKPYHGGSDMIKDVSFSHITFQEPPLKFEAGTPPIAEIIGLGAAIKYLTFLDRNGVIDHEEKLLEYATNQLQQVNNLKIYGVSEKKGGIISFLIEKIHPLDLGTLIALRGVAMRTGMLCAQPALNHFGIQSVCRISFGLYNTLEEIDLFLESLKRIISAFA